MQIFTLGLTSGRLTRDSVPGETCEEPEESLETGSCQGKRGKEQENLSDLESQLSCRFCARSSLDAFVK